VKGDAPSPPSKIGLRRQKNGQSGQFFKPAMFHIKPATLPYIPAKEQSKPEMPHD
jgi:hypothetical protein